MRDPAEAIRRILWGAAFVAMLAVLWYCAVLMSTRAAG